MADPKSNVVAIKSKVDRSKTFNVDGWNNILTAIGLKGRDKRLAAGFETVELTEEEAEDLWAGDDMAARAIETIPSEIIRAGWDVVIQPEGGEEAEEDPSLDPTDPSEDPDEEPEDPREKVKASRKSVQPFGRRDKFTSALPEEGEAAELEDGKALAEEVTAKLEELDAATAFLEAMQFARAYGGGAILLGVLDGAKDLRKPLKLEKIESLAFLTTLQPRELRPVRWYKDPRAANFGEAEVFEIVQDVTGSVPKSERVYVHESRLIIFQGVKISRRRRRARKGWGDSVLNRMAGVLRDFHMSWDGTAILLNDFSQAIFKMKGLAEALQGQDDDLVIKRATLVDMSRSIARAVLLDSEEDFDRKTTNVAGLPDLLEKFCLRLAAAVSMPVTLLMGQSPAGLNATGNSDVRFFYDSIGGWRDRVFRPRFNRFMQVLFAAKDGPTEGREPENWSVEFGSFWQLDDLQEAERRLKNAQADKSYVDAGVLTPEEVASARFGGDKYGDEITLDMAIREEADVEAEEEAEAEAARLQEEMKLKAKAGVPGGGPPFGGGAKPPAGRPGAPAAE